MEYLKKHIKTIGSFLGIRMEDDDSKLVGEWIFFILAPPITLILVIEFAKILFGLGAFYGFLFLIGGIVAFIAEIYGLVNRTKEALGI